MRLIDHMRSMQRVFQAHVGRTLLTLLGIMIGAGSIVLLAGLLRGGEEALIRSSQFANEADMIQVWRDEPPTKQLNRTRRELSHRDAAFLDDSPLLQQATVSSEFTRDAQAEFGRETKRVRMVAGTPIMLSLNRLSVAQGRFVSTDDLQQRTRVCVVGNTVWRELLGSREAPLGATIRVLGESWTVVGVLARKPPITGGEPIWGWDNKVLVPQTTFDSLFEPQHRASTVYVRLHAAVDLVRRLSAVQGVVRSTLLRRHLGVENFKVEGEGSFASQERLILLVIKLMLLGTGLLSLLVGGINIMNIMLVTVTERTREIGVRRAVGASPRTILAQFLLESSTIAMMGGVLGVLGGILLSWLVAKGLEQKLGNWNFHVELWSVAVGLGLSVLTGISFGVLPARRAAALNPVEALRYE